jgi:hypothetical protein
VGAGFCAAGVWIAQTIATNITIEKRNLAVVTRRLIGFFLYGMKARTNLTIFWRVARDESGNFNLPIGGPRDAIKENGVPGIAAKQS